MLKFGAGFVAGFVALFVLMLIFGDYSDAPVAAAQPIAASQAPTVAPLRAVDTNEVLAAFTNAGIQSKDINANPSIAQDSPLPKTFRQYITWNDALLGDKGGGLFVCDTPDLCATLVAYYRMFPAFAPYVYTSPSGLVVAQVNSGFTPDQAARYRDALAGF